jgi:hypothetical protein
MKQDITTFRIRKRQNRAQRPAFAFQEPLYAGFSAGSPVLNEVELVAVFWEIHANILLSPNPNALESGQLRSVSPDRPG